MAMIRPDDWDGPLLLDGIGRDLVTTAQGDAIVVDEDRLAARVVKPDLLAALSTSPDWPEVQALIGQPAISGLRRRLGALIADRFDRERPLGTLLDDIAATTLISGWAMLLKPGSPLHDHRPDPARRSRMEGTCVGLSGDTDAFREVVGRPEPVRVADVARSEDAQAWHAMPPALPFEMRRVRKIDVWRDGDRLMVDAMFQDSVLIGDGVRQAIHDYGVTAVFDAGDGRLLRVAAEPRILPHDACPRAAAMIGGLIGTPAPSLRTRVLDDLRGAAGCTHLNDALRAFAAVPALGRHLRQ